MDPGCCRTCEASLFFNLAKLLVVSRETISRLLLHGYIIDHTEEFCESIIFVTSRWPLESEKPVLSIHRNNVVGGSEYSCKFYLELVRLNKFVFILFFLINSDQPATDS
jgi:hypothetical protein